jgi:hypothetical protein
MAQSLKLRMQLKQKSPPKGGLFAACNTAAMITDGRNCRQGPIGPIDGLNMAPEVGLEPTTP